MRKIAYTILSLSIFLGSIFRFPIISYAREASVSDITVDDEYVICDEDGYNTRYVIVATNNSSNDIVVSAVFNALSEDGAVIKTVSDYGLVVKAQNAFILYGQFKSEEVKDATFSYDLTVADTDVCRQDSVNIEYAPSEENTLVVTGTNYSEQDVQAVNVRSIFFNEGEPVAFDTVNIADKGYTLHSGSSNTQELNLLPSEYDDYVVTWSAPSDDFDF
ncbi:MAG: hypothetical protein E7301_13860 [Butyrivibrio sp.]|nr:hypothetical protein [Butyrivibrio sp.]